MQIKYLITKLSSKQPDLLRSLGGLYPYMYFPLYNHRWPMSPWLCFSGSNPSPHYMSERKREEGVEWYK